MDKTVDVIIPAHNAESSIHRSVLSALNQTGATIRVIVVDDASTDSTTDILKKLASIEDRCVVKKLEENVGAGVARRIGLDMVAADYVGFLDADDVWLPGKIERTLSFMEANSLQLAHTERYIFSEEKSVFLRDSGGMRRTGRWLLSLKNPICTSSAMLSTHIDGFRDMPEIRARQDYIYWRRLYRANPGLRVGKLMEPLVIYNKIAGSLSSSPRKNVVNNFQAFYHAEGRGLLYSSIAVLLNSLAKIGDLIVQRSKAVSHDKAQALVDYITELDLSGRVNL